jgi:hypothetical protein
MNDRRDDLGTTEPREQTDDAPVRIKYAYFADEEGALQAVDLLRNRGWWAFKDTVTDDSLGDWIVHGGTATTDISADLEALQTCNPKKVTVIDA